MLENKSGLNTYISDGQPYSIFAGYF